MRSFASVLIGGSVILFLIASGCIESSSETPVITRIIPRTPLPTEPPQEGPSGVTWYLVSLADGSRWQDIIPGTVITAFFDGQATVFGSGGCNKYNASYSGNKTELFISPPVVTENTTCEVPAGIMDQQKIYFSVLPKAISYIVIGDSLIINDSMGKTVLLFSSTSPSEAVPAPLIGTRWRLFSVTDQSGRTLMPESLTTITLMLSPNGNAYGNAGCNDYVTPYLIGDNNSLSFGTFGETQMICGIGGVMELEADYLESLRETRQYIIVDQQLIFSNMTGKKTMIFNSSHGGQGNNRYIWNG